MCGPTEKTRVTALTSELPGGQLGVWSRHHRPTAPRVHSCFLPPVSQASVATAVPDTHALGAGVLENPACGSHVTRRHAVTSTACGHRHQGQKTRLTHPLGSVVPPGDRRRHPNSTSFPLYPSVCDRQDGRPHQPPGGCGGMSTVSCAHAFQNHQHEGGRCERERGGVTGGWA